MYGRGEQEERGVRKGEEGRRRKKRRPVLPGQPHLSYSQESEKGSQIHVERNGDEKTEVGRGQRRVKLNYAWQGSWRK